jgi:hypothetical protein
LTINCDCSDTSGYRTLLELRQDMMRRLGYGAQITSPPPGVADLLTSFLQDAQRSLIRRYPTLRTERWFSWSLTAGERFYDLPDNDEQTDTVPCTKQLDPLRITWVGAQRDSVWYPLIRGIPPTVLGRETTNSWPTFYDIRQCIEIWPAPAATEGTLRIRAHFKAEPFAADTDKPTIDDHAVFLLALANAKAHYGKPDANAIVSQLEVYIQSLVAGTHGPQRYIPGQNRNADMVYVEPKPSVPFA